MFLDVSTSNLWVTEVNWWVSWFQCLSWKDSFLSLFIYLSVHSHIFHISLVNLLKHWLCRRFETCSYRQLLCDQHPFLFFPNPPYRINTKINSWRKVISLSLDDCRTLHVFFVKKNTFISNTKLRFDSK